MTSKHDFQVTLPSNASMVFHPSNKPNHYVTELASPIHLEGSWEVALVDIQFPHNWQTVAKDCVGTLAVLVLDDTIYKSPPDLARATNEVKLILDNKHSGETKECVEILNEAYNDIVEARGLVFSRTPHFQFRDFTIPRGYYESVSQLGEECIHVFNALLEKLGIAKKIVFHFFPITGRCSLAVEDHSILVALLFKEDTIFKDNLKFTKQFTEKGRHVYDLPMDGAENTRVDHYYSLYVYSDVVNHQLVGDTLAPLMGVVPIQIHANGNQLYWAFNPTHYMPVSRNEIKNIEIQINTDQGAPFPFLGDRVVCRLHFRRRGGDTI